MKHGKAGRSYRSLYVGPLMSLHQEDTAACGHTRGALEVEVAHRRAGEKGEC